MKRIEDLRGRNIVVYDLEIKNVIDGKNITWNDHHKMGISVGCLFDYRTGDNHVYLDDNLVSLWERLLSAEMIVGFNILGFDNKLLQATMPGIGMNQMLDMKSFDLLKEVRRSTGQQYPRGCNLNEVLSATFGMKKTEDGADAPIFYQEGKIGKLVTYCLADVRRERMAFEYAYVNGHLKTATHGIHNMRSPFE